MLEADGARRLANESFFSAPQLKRDPLRGGQFQSLLREVTMRAVWLITGALFCSITSALAQASVDWMSRETGMWQAVKDKRIDAFSAGLDSSFVGVYAEGLHNRDTEISQVRPANLREFHLSDFTVHRLGPRSEEHTSELQSQSNLVCRLLLE